METIDTLLVSYDPPGSSSSDRERVVLHARDLFLAHGFSQVSMDDLAGSLSMSKKTLYKLFDSKENLLAAVIDRLMGDFRAIIEGIIAGPGSFPSKVRAFSSFAGKFLARVTPAFARDLQRAAPGQWERVEAFRRDRILENFGRLLRQGMEEGAVRKDLNVRVFQLAHLGAIEKVIHPAVLASESFSGKEAIEEITRIIFIGIMTDEARKEYSRDR
jgi:AcrR family transcriptional regulator